ncbi:uncharacterized protein LOC120068989 [Benincasa hispida]|uniref:uncharacterized protein LOC120068989 n=1 Tax=Benincasa hispida TaxID=102211 RepID=UPI001901E466|nr:uncharacterized protein LOC120068989 [Benincasa hispida]
MTNQETYLKECATKAQDMLKKLIKKNQELELDLLMHQLHQGHYIFQLTNGELHTLLWMVGERIRDCRKRIDYHQQVHRLPPPPTEFVPSNSPLLEIGSNEMDLVDNGRNLIDQWFIDMVMNLNDKIGGSSSNMAVELGFVQSEVNMGDLMNGGISMVGIGELGGTKTIPKLVNDINGVGVEATVSHMDFTHQAGFGIGGDVNGGDGRLYSSTIEYCIN